MTAASLNSPAAGMGFHQSCQQPDMIRPVIQAGDVMVGLATVLQEVSTVFNLQFFQRFQTISRKRRADDINPPDAVLCPLLQCLIGIGFDPLLTTKTRLKRTQPLIIRQPQFSGNSAGCGPALVRIGIAHMFVAFRNTMKR